MEQNNKNYNISISANGSVERLTEFIKKVLDKLPEATNGIGKNNSGKTAEINTMYPFYDEVRITLQD